MFQIFAQIPIILSIGLEAFENEQTVHDRAAAGRGLMKKFK